MEEKITMAHGSGGGAYRRLVEEIILPAFRNPLLEPLGDAAICPGAEWLALTTDSFVVRPLFFPGGDIGRLAVSGTVNDLAAAGARPRYLTVGMILEAGLPLETLRRVVGSMAEAAREAGVDLVTGDTKVAETAGGGLFINTAGVGFFGPDRPPVAGLPQPGDAILVSGPLGSHGMAVLAARENLAFSPVIQSDAAPLGDLTEALLAVCRPRALRDPTRGGAAATICEWARPGLRLTVEEEALPVEPPVARACELLGMDVLQVANEGVMMACVPEREAERALAAWRAHPLGKKAALVGRVEEGSGEALLRGRYGALRRLYLPEGELLPRIC